MVYLTKKKIKGKEYLYLVESIRLPDGTIKKISKLIKDKNEKNKYKNLFERKKRELFIKYALEHYKYKYPIAKEDIIKTEEIKFNYKKIITSLNKAQLKDLFDRFTVNFTYESNAIEGNSLKLKDVAIVLFEKQTIKGKELREIYETRNSRKAMDLLLSKKIKITHKSIINLHKVLMKDIDIRQGYKKIPNFILGSNLKTSLPEKTHTDMTKLIKWYNEQKKTLHPIILISIFHGRFLEIHPFEDGNGRTARFLLNTILVNKEYPPLIIRKTNREKYIKCLRAFDKHSDINLIRFILDKFKKTYNKFFEIYVKYLWIFYQYSG